MKKLLKMCTPGDVVSRRGIVTRIEHVSSSGTTVDVHWARLDENDWWVKDAYAQQFPAGQIIRLIGHDDSEH